jgi:hypothetical protein
MKRRDEMIKEEDWHDSRRNGVPCMTTPKPLAKCNLLHWHINVSSFRRASKKLCSSI